MDSPFVFEVIHSVEVPSEISAQGRAEITEQLERLEFIVPDDWDWRWMNKSGALTKRLEKAFKEKGRTIPAHFNQMIGELAQMHSLDSTTYHLRYTRDLNWLQGEFGDETSCFFGGRSDTWTTLRKYNVHAVQFFGKIEDEFVGIGRCFGYEIQPNLHALFNAYGRLYPDERNVKVQGRNDASVVRIANIVALQSGLGQYRRIQILNDGQMETGDVYVNSAGGYVIGPATLIRNISAIDLHMQHPDTRVCLECGRTTRKEKLITHPENPDLVICASCVSESYRRCVFCDTLTKKNELSPLDDTHACKKCRSGLGRVCGHCGYFGSVYRMTYLRPAREWACRSCSYERVYTCVQCFEREWVSQDHGDQKCRACHEA